ncbi:MAG: ferredoxin [Dehalococcoidales bacterium]|nr:ferredoxin [Dehalococcoidales bacterium]
MRARVDRDVCIGAGNCVAIAPEVFQLDAEAKAVVLDPNAVDEDTLIEAAESCPVSAIVVEDNEGRQVFP